jgi:bifunctional DNA primase/polymerase-like protein
VVLALCGHQAGGHNRAECAVNPRQAAALAERYGFAIFELRYRDKRPACRDWERRASSDPREIATFWPGWDANAGIACGPSEVVGIDLDPPNGIAQFRSVGAGRELPPTFTVRTPRNGVHLVFAAIPGREIRNSAKKIAPGVDVRGGGGYLVAPGSVLDSRAYSEPVRLANGGRYVRIDGRPPAPLPGWLADLILAKPEPAPRGSARPIASGTGYGCAALRAEAEKVTSTRRGSRNHHLNVSAFKMGQLMVDGVLEMEVIFTTMMSAAADCGLVADDGAAQCERTIRGGIAAGAASPRQRAVAR